MKRPIKPFVVEVRKGQKKSEEANQAPQPAPAPKPGPRNATGEDALRRAESMLFSASPAPVPASPPARTGRILASLDETTAPVEVEKPVRRRGRPPGSLNKPKSATPIPAGPPKRRGRPPKHPPQPLRQIDPATAQTQADPTREPFQASAAPTSLPHGLQRMIGLDREEVAAHLARIPAGERWKRRLRGAARLAFERRHTKV